MLPTWATVARQKCPPLVRPEACQELKSKAYWFMGSMLLPFTSLEGPLSGDRLPIQCPAAARFHAAADFVEVALERMGDQAQARSRATRNGPTQPRRRWPDRWCGVRAGFMAYKAN